MKCHKCRYCANAVLNDFDFTEDIESVLIYCEADNKIKGEIDNENKCEKFEYNAICVWTGEEIGGAKC